MASELRPKLKAPPGACDTHMHIYNHRFPTAATAKFTQDSMNWESP